MAASVVAWPGVVSCPSGKPGLGLLSWQAGWQGGRVAVWQGGWLAAVATVGAVAAVLAVAGSSSGGGGGVVGAGKLHGVPDFLQTPFDAHRSTSGGSAKFSSVWCGFPQDRGSSQNCCRLRFSRRAFFTWAVFILRF